VVGAQGGLLHPGRDHAMRSLMRDHAVAPRLKGGDARLDTADHPAAPLSGTLPARRVRRVYPGPYTSYGTTASIVRRIGSPLVGDRH
jgi:hypothetical protein